MYLTYAKITISRNGDHKMIVKGKPKKKYEKEVVYRIRLDKTPICRAIKSDSEGVLSIGRSANFHRRFGQIKNGIRNGQGHSEAALLHFLLMYADGFWNMVRGKEVIVEYQKTNKSKKRKDA